MRRRYAATAMAVIALTLAACQGGESERVRIAFIPGQIGITFYTSMECGAKNAAEEFDVDLTWQGPSNWDINEQQPFIDAALQTDPDGWVIAPTDSIALVPTIRDLMASGKPVVTVDAPLDEPVELQNLQSDHYGGGQQAAAAMLDLTGGTGSYLVLHLSPGLPDIGGRADGFRDAMVEAGANVLEYVYPETDSNLAAEQVSAAILARDDLAGVYATHESAALGAASAIRAAGKSGEIRLVAFDAAPSQVADLKDGLYDALIAQQPYKMGWDSVELVAKAVRGEVDLSTVVHDNPTGFAIITRDNADSAEVAPFIYTPDLSQCPTGPPNY